MKENSIEKKLENIQNVNLITLLRQFKKEGVQNFIVLRRSNFDEILSDYKRVLKENEYMHNELDKQQITINKYAKENEELKALDLRNSKIIANMSTRHFQDREKIRNSIPIQKIKDKIEQYKKILLNCNRFSDVDRIKAINERILELQELLEKQ